MVLIRPYRLPGCRVAPLESITSITSLYVLLSLALPLRVGPISLGIAPRACTILSKFLLLLPRSPVEVHILRWLGRARSSPPGSCLVEGTWPGPGTSAEIEGWEKRARTCLYVRPGRMTKLECRFNQTTHHPTILERRLNKTTQHHPKEEESFNQSEQDEVEDGGMNAKL